MLFMKTKVYYVNNINLFYYHLYFDLPWGYRGVQCILLSDNEANSYCILIALYFSAVLI